MLLGALSLLVATRWRCSYTGHNSSCGLSQLSQVMWETRLLVNQVYYSWLLSGGTVGPGHPWP